MKALSVVGPYRVEIVERPVPPLEPDEALIKTAVATICHTDHYILSGNHPFATYPVTPGHEFSGVIAAVGSAVTHIQPGARVAVQTLLPCGHCRFCRSGDINLCDSLLELGSHRRSFFVRRRCPDRAFRQRARHRTARWN